MSGFRHVRVTNAGECYRLAFEFVENHPEAVLVHGYPRLTGGPHQGQRYGHAWAEVGEGLLVHDPHYPDYLIPVATYYEVGQIDPAHCQRYTMAEARRMAVEHRQYGPWGEVPALDEVILFAEAG